MPLSPGTRLGPYEILSAIGAGGMGEVYRAKDTRLDRTVAIKILPSHLSNHPDSKQRFEREARTISSLSHPYICALHDVGHQDGIDFLVMEFLKGETLAQRLSKGPLTTELVFRYGIQIADALDKAHRQSIVHRDLKPGNVMITKSGAKLLDFGLAKLQENEPVADSPEVSRFATQDHLTEEGVILGTVQYMAPEQVEGKQADSRTDIFALGEIIYEMATGQKAFTDQSKASLISAILTADPRPISLVQPLSPPALDHLVKKCLAKDPDERWQSAHDVGGELKWLSEGTLQSVLPTAIPSPHKIRSRLLFGITGGILGALIASFIVWNFFRVLPSPTSVTRFSITLPENQELSFAFLPSLAISPDGRSVIYSAQEKEKRSLYMRRMDQLTAAPVSGTEGGTGPSFSPDGKWIGFISEGLIKKVPVEGGVPQTVCEASESIGFSWTPDGTIYFVPKWDGGLYRVSASGGTPSLVASPDVKQGERGLLWPDVLPSGKAVLLTVYTGGGLEDYQIIALSFSSGERKTLIKKAIYARYFPPGFILYAHGDSLFAVSFDPEKLRITGSPFVVLDSVTSTQYRFCSLQLFPRRLAGLRCRRDSFPRTQSGLGRSKRKRVSFLPFTKRLCNSRTIA